MAKYSELKAAMEAVIKPNGAGKITGAKHQQVLRDVIDTLGAAYQFGGVAHPGDTFDKNDINVAFLAYEAGTYFGGIELDGTSLQVLLYDGEWSAVDTGISTAAGGYVHGIVSQKVEFTGSQFVVSDPVEGEIPLSFIELVTGNAPEGTAGKVEFDEGTGYFKLNGIEDIAYDEMLAIYSRCNIGDEVYRLGDTSVEDGGFNQAIIPYTTVRTNMCHNNNADGNVILRGFARNTALEVIRIVNGDAVYVEDGDDLQLAFASINYPMLDCPLRAIYPVLSFERQNFTTPFGIGVFGGCNKLEHVEMKNIRQDINLVSLTSLSAHSVAYMVSYSVGTITITLNRTAYDRAIADAEVQAALVQKPNVSLAEA